MLPTITWFWNKHGNGVYYVERVEKKERTETEKKKCCGAFVWFWILIWLDVHLFFTSGYMNTSEIEHYKYIYYFIFKYISQSFTPSNWLLKTVFVKQGFVSVSWWKRFQHYLKPLYYKSTILCVIAIYSTKYTIAKFISFLAEVVPCHYYAEIHFPSVRKANFILQILEQKSTDKDRTFFTFHIFTLSLLELTHWVKN